MLATICALFAADPQCSMRPQERFSVNDMRHDGHERTRALEVSHRAPYGVRA